MRSQISASNTLAHQAQAPLSNSGRFFAEVIQAQPALIETRLDRH